MVYPVGCSQVGFFKTLYQHHIKRTAFHCVGSDKKPLVSNTDGDSILVHYTPKDLLKKNI